MCAMRTIVLLVAACFLARDAAAGAETMANGVAGPGHVTITVDDYGAYGTWIGPMNDDYVEVGGAQPDYATWMSGAYVFVTTPNSQRTAVVLTDERKWITIEEPGGGADGIVGDHPLERRVTTPNVIVSANELRSAFTLTEAGNGAVRLSFALRQVLTFDPPTNSSRFDQIYDITNNGTTDVALGFHAHWDADLVWTNSFDNDIVGAGAGLCYVYIRDPDGVDQAVALSDAGSTVPITYYYGGKAGVTPPNGPPVYQSTYYSTDVFDMLGTPPSWRNNIVNVGYDTAGESGEMPGENAVMALEYRFPLPINATVTIAVRRTYGTHTLPCGGGPGCGNGALDIGEMCDSSGTDTVACNGATCTPAICGDGYVNMAAGEVCESGGVDAAHCNGAACRPTACGDGYVNAAAGERCDDGGETRACNTNCQPAACGDGTVNLAADEQCEAGALCDLATCTYSFQLGGGCTGCGAGGGESSLWLGGALIAGRLQRRRRHGRAPSGRAPTGVAAARSKA